MKSLSLREYGRDTPGTHQPEKLTWDVHLQGDHETVFFEN